MTNFLEFAISQTWQVTILCVVTGWLSRFWLRSNPYLSYQLGLIVMVKCVTPPIWSSPCGVFSWVSHNVSDATNYAVTATLGNTVDANLVGTIVFCGWLGGLAFSIGRTWLSWRHIQRNIKTNDNRIAALNSRVRRLATSLGVTRKVSVVTTSQPIGPAVIGIRRPLLILPETVVAGKSFEYLDPILTHELMHIRRGDTWIALFETFVRAVWWFHPSVHNVAKATSVAGEFCCDQDVLRVSQCQPKRYAEMLLNVIESKCRLQAIAGRPGIRFDQITEERLRRIMTAPARQPRNVLQLSLLMLGLLLLLPGQSVTGTRLPNETPIAHQTADTNWQPVDDREPERTP